MTVVAVVLLAASYCYFRGKEYVIELTESEIKQKLVDRFPVTKCFLAVMCLSLTEPLVRLDDSSDRISFGAHAALNITVDGKQLQGAGEFSGRIRYASENGEFYLDNAAVKRLQINGLPETFSERVNELAKTGVDEYLKKRPIYRLRQTDFKHAVTRMILKEVRVNHGVLVITLGIGS